MQNTAIQVVADLSFPARDGRIVRGRLRHPSGARRGFAVLCHPHPAFGGNMDVWLLPTIGERLAADGWSVLRFDFRADVGDGAAAVEDLAGAVTALETGGGPVALVGWSFGALVGLLYGPHDPRVTQWVGIAPPTQPLPGLAMPGVPDVSRWTARRTAIVGEHEQFFPDPSPASPHVTHVVPGADHFFFDRDGEVADLVAASLV